MAKERASDDVANRGFIITIVGTLLFIAAVVLFVL
jgi:hypothetical protein